MLHDFLKIQGADRGRFSPCAPKDTPAGAGRFAHIHLQWFAAEDEGRTEEPTERKLRRAREEDGAVVKSKELIDALVLLLPAITIFFIAPSLLKTCTEMLRFFITRSIELDPVKDRVIFLQIIWYFIRIALPIIAVAAAAALIANIAQDMAQFGLSFSTKPLAFKFSKIIPNFAAYFQKTLFSANGAFNMFKSIIKMIVIGGVAFFLIRSEIEKIANLQRASLITGIELIGSLAIRMLIISALFLLILSIPDYVFQRWQHRESLKMSKQELKEEWKEEEGDPQVRSRIRQRMRELLTQNIRKNVPKADVVITNPTHLAIALEYHANGPRVLAKGEDELALRIKQIAIEHNVPVEENKPIARALYAAVDVGDIVPKDYWEIIGKILIRVRGIDYMNRRIMGQV
ncbi:MAG: flagellar biosynthesis protein FlhB [Spirochaetaceae bacterium]|jgi:flagellar biosynthetic protein FlhB|nr:flagellar biosynthesis protein FlhB [Spirochaetaceae bacterium]